MAEVAIPLMAMGAMYIISNQNKEENFSVRNTSSQLPNTNPMVKWLSPNLREITVRISPNPSLPPSQHHFPSTLPIKLVCNFLRVFFLYMCYM